MIFFVEELRQNHWFIDFITNVHVYNDKLIITKYQNHPTKVKISTLNGVLLGKSKIRFRLGLNNNLKDLILNLQNIYYFPNSPYNLVSFGLLNNSGIYHNNKHESFYQINSRKILVKAKR